MKVSVFVHDLSSNPIGRMHPLLQALKRLGHEIEVLGFLIGQPEIYLPYRNSYLYKTLPSSGTLKDVLGRAQELSKLATGDLVYAGKPLITSYYPALLASGFGRRKPLLLDVEDDDVWGAPGSDTSKGLFNCYVRGFRSATACKWGILLHPFTHCAHTITVSSRRLQKRYNGEIVRHGPDEEVFDPSLGCYNRGAARARFGIASDMLAIGFAGTPHPHKGFQKLIAALQICRYPFQLLLCGPSHHPEFLEAQRLFGDRCRRVGLLPNSEMPSFLSAVEIVPILQESTRYTQAQLPAKLLEAMAMKKCIVASRVGDLPEILGGAEGESRGWIVDSSEPMHLSAMLDELAATPPDEVFRRTSAARTWYVKHASIEANCRIYRRLLGSIV